MVFSLHFYHVNLLSVHIDWRWALDALVWIGCCVLLQLVFTGDFLFYSSSFTKLPHLAGTEQNFLLAKQIQGQWKEFGLDSAELVHYDVLLSYPSETQPNYISVIDDRGNEVIFLMIKLYLCKISFKKRCLPLSSHSLFRALGLIILKKLRIKKS